MNQTLSLYLIFRSDFTFGHKIYTVDGETLFVELPAFLGRSSDCCGLRSILNTFVLGPS